MYIYIYIHIYTYYVIPPLASGPLPSPRLGPVPPPSPSSLVQIRQRGSAPKGGRQYDIFRSSVKALLIKCPAVQWRPAGGLTMHTHKWFLGAGFLGAPPISLSRSPSCPLSCRAPSPAKRALASVAPLFSTRVLTYIYIYILYTCIFYLSLSLSLYIYIYIYLYVY